MSSQQLDITGDQRASYTAEGLAAARYLLSLDPITGVHDRESSWYLDWVFYVLSRTGLHHFARFMYRRRLPGVFPWHMTRVHHFDRRIVHAVREGGVKQVCLLGAGYDDRALRLADEFKAHGAVLYEVDMRATQQRKKAILYRRLPTRRLPEHVRYVACDFNTERVDDKLLEAGWRADAPSFYVWEGVVYYLTVEAIDTTLRALGSIAAPESRLGFDYPYAGVVRKERDKYPGLVKTMGHIKRTGGETFIFDAVEPGVESLRAFVEARGTHLCEHWDRDALLALYGEWLKPAEPKWDTLPTGFAIAEVSWRSPAS